ncbi:hypothetical protein BD769DRAFT_1681411 [Suillus cothurnatus]|nr:hypothetical protein BD769DRAFT_1681411 [Suillus cothurnatus]
MSPPSNSFPSLCATLPAHTFYRKDSHSAVETLQWMPTESSLRMDAVQITLRSVYQCLGCPGSAPLLHYGPPPRFDSQPEFPSLLYPSPPIFDGQPEQCFVTPGLSNREVAFPSLHYTPPPRFEDQPEQRASAGLSNTFSSRHYAPSPIFDPPKYPEHYPPSDEPPIQSLVESLIPPSIQELEQPTTSIFKDIQVFVYEAAPVQWRAAEGSLSQQATNETTVLAPVPSSWILPPPPLPTTNTDTADHTSQLDHTRQPNLPQFLMTMDQTEVMKEAKQIM